MEQVHAQHAAGEHPTIEQLRAFGQGRLRPDEQDWVEQHIEHCGTCVETLLGMPDDTLLNRLKDCDTSIPETLASEHAAAGLNEPVGGIPPELQDHPRYRIISRLGKGGMGVVYKAEHRLMGRPVALKVINQKLVRSKTAVDRFQLEVRAAAKLAHPGIVTAHDADQAGDVHFLVMEFVDGTDVATQLKKAGPLPVRHACHFARQAALGLQHAHEMGAVHRDIKPQNLMITREGRLKILDFGLARLASEADVDSEAAKLTKDGVMLGTPDYMAPEQILDCRQADIRADIYSLGATLYSMLTGRVPFPGGSAVDKLQAQLNQQPDNLSGLRDDLPEALVALVGRMMAKDLAERYQSPGEVAAALQPFCRGNQPAAPPKPQVRVDPEPLDLPLPAVADRLPSYPVGKRQKRGPINAKGRWLAGGLGMLVLLAAGLVLMLPKHRILMVVPFNNFWGREFYDVRRHLEDAGFHVDVASSREGEARPTDRDVAEGENYAPVSVDHVLGTVDLRPYSAVLFTGAWPTEDLEFAEDSAATADAHRVILEMRQAGKYVTAICGGSIVLGRSGVLDGQRAAYHDFLPPDLENSRSIKWAAQPTVVSDKIITARRDVDAEEFVNLLRQSLR